MRYTMHVPCASVPLRHTPQPVNLGSGDRPAE